MSTIGRAVGIDLGTTYSAIAALGPDGRPVILANREGERITPSVVLFHDDGALVGSAAKQAAADAPDDVVQFVKRRMGDRSWAFVTSTGEEVDAESVSAAILRRLKVDAELALGEPVTHAVITVPAYFDDARRQATIDAGEIAGFTVLGVINEPTAAAVHDGLETGMQGNVLVYDLGGGTFDVTVMRIDGNDFRVLSVQGDRNLGGFNWDNELMRYIADQVHRESGVDPLEDDLLEAELRDKAERAKRALTTTPETRVVLRVDRRSYSVKVTRALFDELTRGLLARTRSNVELALADARLAPSDIDELLLVGGSTRMPMVRELLTAMIGRPPRAGGYPDEAVALGAAVQAGLLAAATTLPTAGSPAAPA
ncbi:Hsp70 family protein, partial [Nakamurella sp.]|uniref:Hsp70 family protein n=1 Tax=Nakamurella sp. TaxID=1869182 RepID=UPI003B3B61CA